MKYQRQIQAVFISSSLMMTSTFTCAAAPQSLATALPLTGKRKQDKSSSNITAKMNLYLNSVRTNPEKLKQFLRRMPKGGELHTHLSGIPSADSLLRIAAVEHRFRYYVRIPKLKHSEYDPTAFALTALPLNERPKDPALISVETLLTRKDDVSKQLFNDFRRAMILSSRDENPRQKFCLATFQRRRALLRTVVSAQMVVREAVKQAHEHNLIYVELQVDPAFIDPLQKSEQTAKSLTPLRLRQNLLLLSKAAHEANANFSPNERVTVRFLLSLNRENLGVFKKLPIAFQLANAPDLKDIVAGINICGDEYADKAGQNGEIASPVKVKELLIDLHKKYPHVKFAIHAGESLHFDKHVSDAIALGASRIGHAINIGDASREAALVRKTMATKRIAIENCPSSNSILLGLPVSHDPSLAYLRAGIPVSIGTDDAGIFETDITNEFTKLVETHPEISWDELKQICRNSINHAFLANNERRTLLSRFDSQMLKFQEKMCADFNALHLQRKKKSD
ncbi:MAG: hypothetical protein K2X27_12450 [Candidatus Obscuribacterales bacterium]|nr:hypothetical protein [Candidatus Obscuribacterales bacterium]